MLCINVLSILCYDVSDSLEEGIDVSTQFNCYSTNTPKSLLSVKIDWCTTFHNITHFQ